MKRIVLESKMTELYLPDPVVPIRADCKVGQFKIGEERFLGNSLRVSIVVPPIEYIGGFYNDCPQKDWSKMNHRWKQIWYCAAPDETKIPKGCVFPTMLKTSSLSELDAFSLLNGQNTFYEFICEMRFKVKTSSNSDSGSYFMVVFSPVDRASKEQKSQVKLIENFLKEEPLFYDESLPEGIINSTGLSFQEKQALLLGNLPENRLIASSSSPSPSV